MLASYGRLAAGRGRHAYIPIKMASGVQDITCVFVEVAGSYEKKLHSYSVLGWCVVHQWCQNVLVRLTGGWNYYITLNPFFSFPHTVGNFKSNRQWEVATLFPISDLYFHTLYTSYL